MYIAILSCNVYYNINLMALQGDDKSHSDAYFDHMVSIIMDITINIIRRL